MFLTEKENLKCHAREHAFYLELEKKTRVANTPLELTKTQSVPILLFFPQECKQQSIQQVIKTIPICHYFPITNKSCTFRKSASKCTEFSKQFLVIYAV